MAKGEIDHDEQFTLLPQCFQLYLMIKRSFMEIFHIFANMFSKLSAADLLYVGKGLEKSMLILSLIQMFYWKNILGGGKR